MTKDETGNQYGYLSVISKGAICLKTKQQLWETMCACGCKKTVTGYLLRSGKVKSCGCKRKEMIGIRTSTHRMSKTKTYLVWNQMIQRCNNKKTKAYKHYGAKGIKVCDEWMSFDKFLSDIGEIPEGMSIDRIDSNGMYCKENVKLSTSIEQNNNKSSNILIEYSGKLKTLAEWARELNINRGTLVSRLYKLNWSVEKALTTSINESKRNKNFNNQKNEVVLCS